ncbi:hypothetical protein [uncultured Clostridium sp.]|uniref:hypothetical protein n=1 Tax=uncultured Clostridium sp. TaxID=59620 RepID=UPI002620E4D9|nr:hypothetical protein [uncultured Clostridium sp.]
MKVNLEDVIESIEFENESLNHYYNKKTGIIIYVEDKESAGYSADDFARINDFEDWEKELIEALYDFRENPSEYIQLPTKEEMREEDMMIEFLLSLNDGSVKRKELENFQARDIIDIIKEKGQLNEWYDFRDDTEEVIAKAWCRKNNIEF